MNRRRRGGLVSAGRLPTRGGTATTWGDRQLPKLRAERDEEDLVRLYLSDIGQYRLLTKTDEVQLAKAIEIGATAQRELTRAGRGVGLASARRRELRRQIRDGEEAQRAFVMSNLRLVVSIAKKY